LKEDKNHITVFEHQSIKFKNEDPVYKSLEKYYGENGVPYFSLIHNGIRFNEYVGVLQVGNTIIEVLPKADNTFDKQDEKAKWRNVLIDMLHTVGAFKVNKTSTSSLKLKSNSILDLYFELFIKEVEYLLHNGLAKKYRKKEGNVNALKGSLMFSKHIQQNLSHQERFYVRYTTYDVKHKLHCILYKTICLLKKVNINPAMQNSIGTLLLYFPEMPDLKVSETTFSNLVFDRKTESYRNAIGIAKLLLLRYHPDISKGKNDVLALMFNMNELWEQFVYVSLRKHRDINTTITAQTSKYFWKPLKGYRSKIRPDIVINKESKNCLVLDTKWKNLKGFNPSPDDLRQMYVYHEYYNAKKVALIYPGKNANAITGNFQRTPTYTKDDKECSVVLFSVPEKAEGNKGIVKLWQEEIGSYFKTWMNS